jgi:DNA transformation protein
VFEGEAHGVGGKVRLEGRGGLSVIGPRTAALALSLAAHHSKACRRIVMPGPKLASRKLEFVNHVVEQMAEFGPVQAKAMFGGHGIYYQGLMFALIAQDTLYFKADEQSVGEFTARKLGPFTYEVKGGRSTSLSYYEAPPEVMEEPPEMARWARLAYDCALRRRKKPAKRKA